MALVAVEAKRLLREMGGLPPGRGESLTPPGDRPGVRGDVPKLPERGEPLDIRGDDFGECMAGRLVNVAVGCRLAVVPSRPCDDMRTDLAVPPAPPAVSVPVAAVLGGTIRNCCCCTNRGVNGGL